MHFYQVRDYASRHVDEELRDAQGNTFLPVRYCATLDHAAQFIKSQKYSDTRAPDILVVEVDVPADKPRLVLLLNREERELLQLARRCEGGKVWEIGPRGGLREAQEFDV